MSFRYPRVGPLGRWCETRSEGLRDWAISDARDAAENDYYDNQDYYDQQDQDDEEWHYHFRDCGYIEPDKKDFLKEDGFINWGKVYRRYPVKKDDYDHDDETKWDLFWALDDKIQMKRCGNCGQRCEAHLFIIELCYECAFEFGYRADKKNCKVCTDGDVCSFHKPSNRS